MGIAELLENAPQAHFGEINGKALPKNALQVHAAPAHNPINLRIGAGLHELLQLLFLLRRKFRRAAARLDVDQPVGALLIEAMHPVPQRLAIHAADARRLLAIHSVANRRQCQQPPRLIGVLRLRRQAAQGVRLKIIPNSNRCAHLRLPNQAFRQK